jgi:hypothetical protein
MRKITLILTLVLVSFSALYSQANKKTITGKVTTENGEVLAGVTVSEVAGVAKTVTDEKGTYTIQVNSRTSTLRFSYIGYKEAETNITSNSIANVSLVNENGSLAEVVVVGYGVQQAAGIVLNDAFGPEQLTIILPKSNAASSDPLSNLSEGVIQASGVFSIQQEFDNSYAITNIDFLRQQTGMSENTFSKS